MEGIYFSLSQQETQLYDRALKSLLGDEAAEILPQLIEDVVLVSEQNIEIDRSTLKADLVYNVLRKDKPRILNLELQTGYDKNMPVRLLKYHVGLHDKHKLPVISMVMYLFNTTIPESPYIEKDGDEIILTFHFRVLQLWTLDAQHFVQNRIIAMYTLLPAMKNVNAALLIEAIEELKVYYTPSQFGEHLARFRTVLDRSTTLSEQEKKIVEEQIQEYNSLIEGSAFFQQKSVEASVRGAQEIVTIIVDTRFPDLAELAQQRVTRVRDISSLGQLAKQLVAAPNETVVKELLDKFAA